MKVYHSSKEITPNSAEAGTIYSDGKTFLKIAAKDGYINLLEVQLAGKKKMAIVEFLRGFRANQYLKAV